MIYTTLYATIFALIATTTILRMTYLSQHHPDQPTTHLLTILVLSPLWPILFFALLLPPKTPSNHNHNHNHKDTP